MGRFRVDTSIIEQQGGQDFAESDTELIKSSVSMDNVNNRHDVLSTFHDGMFTLENLSTFQMLSDTRKSEKPESIGRQKSFYYNK